MKRFVSPALGVGVGVLALTLAGAISSAGHAQPVTYPNRVVRIIVPFAAGGINDTVARLLQSYLERALGRSVIVENRPGAAGIVGTDAVAKSPPDGHTLLMVAATHTVNPAVHAKMPFDTEKDLAPISLVAQNSFIFLTHPSVAKTLPEFVQRAKAEPGKLNYASPGHGTKSHLVIEIFSNRAGIKMQAITHRGGGPAATATLQGLTHFTALSPSAVQAQLEAGTLQALAVTTGERDPGHPSVPTVAESGFPGFEATQWVGLLTTAGTPKEIIDRINAEVNRALRDPDMIEKLRAQGAVGIGGTPEQFGALISREIQESKEAAQIANIKAQ